MQKQRPTSTRPHGSHFTFYPRSKVYGVYGDLDGVLALTDRLIALGFADEKIDILEGDDGIDTLDSDGSRHGLIARFVRALQGITEERSLIDHYVRALAHGHYVVAVSVPNKRNVVQSVCQALKSSGARDIHYYGTFVVEHISA